MEASRKSTHQVGFVSAPFSILKPRGGSQTLIVLDVPALPDPAMILFTKCNTYTPFYDTKCFPLFQHKASWLLYRQKGNEVRRSLMAIEHWGTMRPLRRRLGRVGVTQHSLRFAPALDKDVQRSSIGFSIEPSKITQGFICMTSLMLTMPCSSPATREMQSPLETVNNNAAAVGMRISGLRTKVTLTLTPGKQR